MSLEITCRNALRDLIALSDVWADWTGLSDQTALRARVGWPEAVETVWPFCAMLFGGGSRTNNQASDSSANFRPAGTINVVLYDRCDAARDSIAELMAADTAFGTRFFALIDELVAKAQDAPLMIEGITYDAVPYVLSGMNTANAVDDDADGDDDLSEVETLFHMGVFSVTFGGF
jgi:hypothetical protein